MSIYFAEDERIDLLDRLAQHLRPGGWLAWATARSSPGVPAARQARPLDLPEGLTRHDDPTPPLPVLIVDDSAVVRQRLKSIIESDPRFRVLLAADPYEAVEVMSGRSRRPILLDVEMPRMDGLTFLRKLMRQHPLPVVLCTDHPERALEGWRWARIEVIPKPDWDDPPELAAWGDRLRESLHLAIAAAGARGRAGPGGRDPPAHLAASTERRRHPPPLNLPLRGSRRIATGSSPSGSAPGASRRSAGSSPASRRTPPGS